MNFENKTELKGYGGQIFSNQVIEYNDSVWFVKQKGESEKKRDLLAYLLGKEWANVAEVVELDEKAKLLIHNSNIFPYFNSNNTWLVKLGQCYSSNEIRILDLDKAVATELVFSLWIRRRDTHSFNRCYTNETNIPIFFDHQTAFLGEPELGNIDTFFDFTKNGPGWASIWRIKNRNNNILTTSFVRGYELNNSPLTIHFVNSQEETLSYIDKTVISIQNQDINIKLNIERAGFKNDEANKIYDFLISNKDNLRMDVSKMKEVITKKEHCTQS